MNDLFRGGHRCCDHRATLHHDSVMCCHSECNVTDNERRHRYYYYFSFRPLNTNAAHRDRNNRFLRLTSKCFFRFDVDVFDVESRFTLGKHRLHCTMIFFP